MPNKGETFECRTKERLRTAQPIWVYYWNAEHNALQPVFPLLVQNTAGTQLATAYSKADLLLSSDSGPIPVSIKKFSTSSRSPSTAPSGKPTLFNASRDSTPAIVLLPNELASCLDSLKNLQHDTPRMLHAFHQLSPLYDPYSPALHTLFELPPFLHQALIAIDSSLPNILSSLYTHHFLAKHLNLPRTLHKIPGAQALQPQIELFLYACLASLQPSHCDPTSTTHSQTTHLLTTTPSDTFALIPPSALKKMLFHLSVLDTPSCSRHQIWHKSWLHSSCHVAPPLRGAFGADRYAAQRYKPHSPLCSNQARIPALALYRPLLLLTTNPPL